MAKASCPASCKVAVCVAIILPIILLVSIGLIVASIEKLNYDEVGIRYNNLERKLQTEPNYEGLYAGPPGFTFIKFSNIYKNIRFNLRCLNKDGVKVNLDVSFQYRPRSGDLLKIIRLFKDEEGYEGVLKATGESALHDACSHFNTLQFQSERGNFQMRVRQRVVFKYDSLFTDVGDLQVNDILRPKKYDAAVQDKSTARADIEAAIQERPRQITEFETSMKEEETQAEMTIDKAHSDARIKLNKANSEADIILNEFTKEAEIYKDLLSENGLGLDLEGFLSYLGIRTIDSAQRMVTVGLKELAKTSYLMD